MKIQAEEKEKERRHELELRRLQLEAVPTVQESGQVRVKAFKLPSFVDDKDDLDAYLLRFERFATSNRWADETRAPSLRALLTGKALDAYSRLPEHEARDYETVKDALLRRYNLTEDGFRMKFRQNTPERGESPQQFIVRLTNYRERWVQLSGSPTMPYGTFL